MPTGADPFGSTISLVPCDCHTVASVLQSTLLAMLEWIPTYPLPPEVCPLCLAYILVRRLGGVNG